MSEKALPALRLSGYLSARWLEDVFGSHMVDIAHVAEFFDDHALVRPDAPLSTNLEVEADREWLAGVIGETMKSLGESNVVVTYLPPTP